MDEAGEMGVDTSGHGVQKPYKTPLRFLLEAVLCVRLTAHYIIIFCMLLLREDINNHL